MCTNRRVRAWDDEYPPPPPAPAPSKPEPRKPQNRKPHQAVLSSSTDVKEARLNVRCLLERSASAKTTDAAPVAVAAPVHVRALLFEEGIMPPPSTVPRREPPYPPSPDAAAAAGVVAEPGGGGAADNRGPVAQASCSTAGLLVGVYLKVITHKLRRSGIFYLL